MINQSQQLGLRSFFKSIRENKGAFVADLLLILFGILNVAVNKEENSAKELDSEGIVLHFLIILTVVPWYGGYLLHHFDSYSKAIRRTLQWILGFVVLSLVVFLVILFFPIMENADNLNSTQSFLVAFGMFFLVLGPLMLIGGYADHRFLDEDEIKDSIPWPQVTLVMMIIILSILFMILIIGIFDPGWTGEGSFLIVMAGFLGGPLLAVICAVPFVFVGQWIERKDKMRLTFQLLRWLVPLIVFNSLIWWNDIVLNHLASSDSYTKNDLSMVLFSVLIGGILPFRILMTLKPPLRKISIIGGVFSISIYMWSIL